MTVFGPISGGNTVEDALETYLKRWLDYYLFAVEREEGITPGSIARPRAWERVTTFDLSLEPQMPAIFIVSPGTGGEKVGREGDGTVRALFDISAVALVDAIDERSVRRLGQIYVSAIRTAIGQRRSLESARCRGADYMGDVYTSVDTIERRTKFGAGCRLQVEFTDMGNFRAGPDLPDPPIDPSVPPEDWPTVRDPDSIPPYNPVTVDQE